MAKVFIFPKIVHITPSLFWILILNLFNLSLALWTTSGGSSSRSAQIFVSSFADPNTGVVVSHRLSLGLNAAYSPLETQNGLVVVTHTLGKEINFLDPNTGTFTATINVSSLFSDMFITSPPVLDSSGTLLILSFTSSFDNSTNVAAFAAVNGNGNTLASLEWGPIDISGIQAVSDILVTPTFALFLSKIGMYAKVDLKTQRVQISSSILCDVNDYFVSAPTQLDFSGSSFITVSKEGCVSAISGTNSRLLWSQTRWQGATGSVIAAPVVDFIGPSPNNTAQAYWLYTGGVICCAYTLTGNICSSWPDMCVSITSNGFVFSGLSIAPDSFDWHGGAVYASDTSGSLVFVSAVNGNSGASGSNTLPGPSYSSSVLIPNAWGAENNALLVLSSDVKESIFAVSAWQVGSNGDRTDDDPSDDDGQATTGLAWRLDLPKDLGSIQSRAGVCVLSDGRIVFISDLGDLVIISDATAALEIDGSLAVIVTSVSVTFGIVIFTAAFIWSRRQRRLVRLAMQQSEKEDTEIEEKSSSTQKNEESSGTSLDAPLLVSVN
jgi:hypothetical protein